MGCEGGVWLQLFSTVPLSSKEGLSRKKSISMKFATSRIIFVF